MCFHTFSTITTGSVRGGSAQDLCTCGLIETITVVNIFRDTCISLSDLTHVRQPLAVGRQLIMDSGLSVCLCVVSFVSKILKKFLKHILWFLQNLTADTPHMLSWK